MVVLASVVMAGCGSKSSLKIKGSRRPDASVVTDGGIDGNVPDDGGEFVDADMMMEGVTAFCDRRDLYTSPRRSIVIVDRFEGTSALALPPRVECGPGSPCSADFESTFESSSPLAGTNTIEHTPAAEGDYPISVTVTTAAGGTATCAHVLHVVVGPPVAMCPEDQPVVTRVSTPVNILGDAFDDEGVTSVLWTTTTSPPGAMVSLAPTDQLQTVFTSNLGGDYALTLRVEDADGASDDCITNVRVTEPPEVVCPSETVRGNTRVPLTVRAEARDDFGIERVSWRLVSRPDGSTLSIVDRNANALTFTPDKVGIYVLEFTATDSDGFSSSCQIRVDVAPSPPLAQCPDTIRTTPLSTVRLTASAIADSDIRAYQWSLVDKPAGSAATELMPANARETSFTPDVAGEYRVRLTLTDSLGATGTCETIILAVNAEGLRVEVFWNAPDRSCDTRSPPCDATDVDLHLLRPMGSEWFDGADDCYYANCTGGGLAWGDIGPLDDPRLDIDDVEGFGPENINLERPAPGVYRVGVHMFDTDSFGGAFSSAATVVNIYCGAGSLTPVATFGPVVLRGGSSGNGNDFWRVADVEVVGGGCRVTGLEVRGNPNVRPADDRRR